MNRRDFLIIFSLTIIVLTMQPHVIAQMGCNIVNLRVQHPETALEGEMIQTTSIVTVNCFFSSVLRVDLVDSGSNTILSSASWPYNPQTSNGVSPRLVNNATAPNELGYWSLSIHAYLASATSGSQFTILIKPNTERSLSI